MSGLPLPDFYRPEHAGQWSYDPDQPQLFEAAQGYRARHGIRPSASDARRVHLLLIDVQKDFCFPRGSLYVGGRSGSGAVEDSARMAEFIYRNLGALTEITATLDSHLAFQIFSPAFWVDADGKPLASHQVLTTSDLDRGLARPNPNLAGWLANGDLQWLTAQARHYCQELERVGKYSLYLWPPHCILGSDGHALVGVIHEARMFHAYVRDMQSSVELKGSNPLTENYSALRPEVLTRHDGGTLDQRNGRLMEKLLGADVLIVAGQAASHCVKSTLDDLLDEILARDPSLARKLYLLTDCMSSVAVPDGSGGFVADFTPQTEAALQRFASAGMNLVKSTDPLDQWPGLTP